MSSHATDVQMKGFKNNLPVTNEIYYWRVIKPGDNINKIYAKSTVDLL